MSKEMIELADRITNHLVTLATTSMKLPLAEWGIISNDVLSAAAALRASAVAEPMREALDNSQSLLAMINHMGSDRPTGIASLDWDNEDLSKLTAEQIAENRSALASLPTPGAVPMREEIIEQCLSIVREMTAKHGSPVGSAYSNGVHDQGVRIEGLLLALKAAPHQRQGE